MWNPCIPKNLPVVRRHPNIVLLMSHFFPRLVLVRGQPQRALGGIRRYCWCHIDALQGPGGHISVNIHYQNPKKMWGVDLTDTLLSIFKGGKGSRVGREQLCRHNDFLAANEEGQAIKTAETLCQHHYLALSEMINELK